MANAQAGNLYTNAAQIAEQAVGNYAKAAGMTARGQSLSQQLYAVAAAHMSDAESLFGIAEASQYLAMARAWSADLQAAALVQISAPPTVAMEALQPFIAAAPAQQVAALPVPVVIAPVIAQAKAEAAAVDVAKKALSEVGYKLAGQPPMVLNRLVQSPGLPAQKTQSQSTAGRDALVIAGLVKLLAMVA